jgi:hypothetical protein
MGNFAGSLSAQQQGLQCEAGEVRFAERLPEQWHLGVAQYALAAGRLMAPHTFAWIKRQDFLAHGP